MGDQIAKALNPLLIDPATTEPYLRLPAPYEHLIVTPYRTSDATALVEHLNDLKVTMTLNGPPYPYLEQHALGFLSDAISSSSLVIANLRAGKHPDGMPIRAIRDNTASDIASAPLIGDCYIDRHGFGDMMNDKLEAERLAEENETKEAGNPTIIYTVGDWLASAYHRQGIMPAVLGALMKSWAIPRMGCTQMKVTAMLGNRASVRVFEKNGFKYVGDVPEVIPIMESKGGGRMGVHVVEWHLEDTEK
ncbi:acyl-CoA N-acyltransferase [Auriculariales sp. MPI-PUGE-AT-0066]|nr:acyl-CoA N-acyltransferase [Auriculariales sp. MPI-PUGE-AT-0066]